MSFWDNVKKFAQPYADEEYDEYEEDEYMDEYEDDRRNSRRRNAAPAPEMNGAPAGFGGAISMMVGILPDGSVKGISIVSHTETAGLGSVAAAKTLVCSTEVASMSPSAYS